MKKLFLIVCLGMLAFACSSIYKYASDGVNESGQRYELQVRSFSEIPKSLLENMNKMGMDSALVLNEYEGRYLNFIFKVDTLDFYLVGKKVGFSESKIEYFRDTRRRFDHNYSTLSSLYIFDAAQRVESGGYDAAITDGDIFVIPIEKVVKRLKKKH